MHIRYNLSLIVLLALGALVPLAAQPSGEFPIALSNALAERLDELQKQHGIRGVVASIVSPRHGVWVGSAGHADPATGDTIAHDRLFGIGSVTKTFTSTLVLQLVQEGSIRLEDTIGTWLRDYKNVNGAITVRQLLQHTGGLFNYTNSQAFWAYTFDNLARVLTPDEILQFVGPSQFAPGSAWQYSNTGYVLLGMIIERVTGKSLEEELERRFLSPLALSSIAMGSADSLPGEVVAHWDDFTGDNVPEDLRGYPRQAIYSGAWAAGGLFSTVRDLALWGDRLYTGTLLSQEMMQEKVKFRNLPSGGGYGLGVMRGNFGGRTAWGHNGGIPGFSTALWHIPQDDITIAVIVNHGSNAPLNILVELLNEYSSQSAAAEPSRASGPRVAMHEARPNPFTNETTIPVETVGSNEATVTVHNLLGGTVRTLSDGAIAGTRSLVWDGLDDAGNRLPSGVYFVRMQSGGETTTRRVIKR